MADSLLASSTIVSDPTAFQPKGYLDSTGKPVTRTPDAVRPGACAIIFNDFGEILLERRSDNGFWGLPGGVVEIGEAVEHTVIREVLEETGLEVVITRLVGIYSDPKHHTIQGYPDGRLFHNITMVFECEHRGGELHISEESFDLRYFGVDALPDDILRSNIVRIRDAVARSPTSFIR